MSNLSAMPGIDEFDMPSVEEFGMPEVYEEVTEEAVVTETPVALDKQIAADLKTFKKQKTVSRKANALRKIVRYTKNQPVSQQTQTKFCNELNSLNTIAKNSKTSKTQINLLLRLFKDAQTSSLIYGGFAKNISDMIQFWEKKLKAHGLSRYQQAIQRRKSGPRTYRGR
jgi:sensor histidine kinase regulating citrate/malate metabolism